MDKPILIHEEKTSSSLLFNSSWFPCILSFLSSRSHLGTCSRRSRRYVRLVKTWSDYAGVSCSDVYSLSQLHTRHCTILSSLTRLLDRKSFLEDSLSVICLGADFREGTTREEMASSFRPLLSSFREVVIYLIGPNVSLRDKDYKSGSLRIVSICGLFHEIRFPSFSFSKIVLAVAFDAGIWGYDTWKPTIRKVCHEMRIPLLITSYNGLEADDDFDVLREIKPSLSFPWGPPALNPYGSLLEWRSVYDGETQSDNRYWVMCCCTSSSSSSSV